MSYSAYECLSVERHGRVGWLINNRPKQLNAMNAQMRNEFAQAWIELDQDPEVRVIVHTGEGRAFQTGVDVAEIAGDGVGMERYREGLEDMDLHFTSGTRSVAKPVITAVNGICAGGGFHWVADADIVMAASDATLLRPPCIHRPGHRHRGHRAGPQDAGRGGHEDGPGRPVRTDRRRTGLPVGHDQPVVDPPIGSPPAAQELAEKVRRTHRRPWPPPTRPVGGLEVGLTDACKAGAKELVSLWGHPGPRRGTAGLRQKREARWQEPEGQGT